MKGKRRKLQSERKRHRKTAAYTEAPQNKQGKRLSMYARKYLWLAKHGLWGFQVPEPKPWKSR
jgi:hypothetical protein